MKLHFWSFLKLQKMKFCQKFFLEIDLFDFTSFFSLDFFNFMAHCATVQSYKNWSDLCEFGTGPQIGLEHYNIRHWVNSSICSFALWHQAEVFTVWCQTLFLEIKILQLVTCVWSREALSLRTITSCRWVGPIFFDKFQSNVSKRLRGPCLWALGL